MPSKRIITQDVGEDDITAIDNQTPVNTERGVDNNNSEENGENIDYIRQRLKQLFMINPSIKLNESLEHLKKIDSMSIEELKTLESSVKAQVQGMLDKRSTGRVIDTLTKLIPGVDKDKLKEDIQNDEHLQKAWNTFLTMKLLWVPEEYKMLVILITHIFNNLNLNFKKKQKNR